jgi:hypothetical protein
LSIARPEPNINGIRNISDDYLEVVNEVESFRFGNTEVAIMSSEISANAIPVEFSPDRNVEIHIGSSECNMNGTRMITNPDPESDTENHIGRNSAIESQKWDSWKNWHAQYQKDIWIWGVG